MNYIYPRYTEDWGTADTLAELEARAEALLGPRPTIERPQVSKEPETRIYVVTDITGAPRLIRTTHPSKALRYVIEKAYSVHVASQEDLEYLLPTGIKVETP